MLDLCQPFYDEIIIYLDGDDCVDNKIKIFEQIKSGKLKL